MDMQLVGINLRRRGMARHKDAVWTIPDKNCSFEAAHLAVLMDLRDELKKLNTLLHCQNFVDIPKTLRSIQRKLPTAKKA